MIELILGDCLEVMPSIPAGSVDAIIADLPYGTTACKWDSIIPLEPLWRECKRILKPNGVIALTADEPFTSVLVLSNLEWFKYKWTWDKVQPAGFLNAKIMPLKLTEDVLIFGKGRITYNPQMVKRDKVRTDKARDKVYGESDSPYGKRRAVGGVYTHYYPNNILEFHNANQLAKLHPTQKPVALMEYLIKTYTNPGDLVLDNTMGSGSTGEACLNTGRRFIGIEKDPGYFEIARNRLAKIQAKENADQLTFAGVI